MATSKLNHDDLGEVTLVRRRGLKYLSIRVDNAGTIRLNLPWYVPKASGLLFLSKKREWIKDQLKTKDKLRKNYKINGRKIIIQRTFDSKSRLDVSSEAIYLKVPATYDRNKRIAAADKLVSNYLRSETEKTIVPIIHEYAAKHGCKVKSINVKKLRSRWGSCDHQGQIKLSLYLYLLPEELWRYVLCHELAHLEHLNHSKNFWLSVERMCPEYKLHRKTLRDYNPNIYL